MRWFWFFLLCSCRHDPIQTKQANAQPSPQEVQVPSTSKERLLQDVVWLSAQERNGRGSLTDDAKGVASWIAEQWRASDLEVSLQEIPGTNHQVNVIGIHRGSEEAIIFGAHYDHLGVIDGQTYFGADDNASGISVLLGLTRALASYKGRTLIFIAFGAEEEGLLGSEAYVQDPVYPLKNTQVMLNFDMVGRDFLESASGKQNTFAVVGAEGGQNFSELLQKATEEEHGHVRLFSAHFLSWLGFERSSDDFPFREHGVTALFFSTSMHPDYHKPSDTIEKIESSQLQLIANVAIRFLYSLE
jgi:Zn-dependent M28 family amino/carboxypeptidase